MKRPASGGRIGRPHTYDPAFVGPWDFPMYCTEGWGAALQAWLKAKGCSTQTLAEALGLSKSAVHYWISGERIPDVHALARMEALRKGGPLAVQALAVRQTLGQFGGGS